ncbi:hypothetical protein PoB_002923300 [Plakobranchus ocellatus]|uniref:Uncharacterized protein n=1 Tax=Plakobranchus ocellatus TaxID=259542 RepID=A0AAV4A7W5_9GAST|nr:hypothetical protein PoB_002923300 [Plakobranchus ocellatus]
MEEERRRRMRRNRNNSRSTRSRRGGGGEGAGRRRRRRMKRRRRRAITLPSPPPSTTTTTTTATTIEATKTTRPTETIIKLIIYFRQEEPPFSATAEGHVSSSISQDATQDTVRKEDPGVGSPWDGKVSEALFIFFCLKSTDLPLPRSDRRRSLSARDDRRVRQGRQGLVSLGAYRTQGRRSEGSTLHFSGITPHQAVDLNYDSKFDIKPNLVHNKVISGYEAPCQARAPMAGLEPATEGSLQISGRTRQPLYHRPPTSRQKGTKTEGIRFCPKTPKIVLFDVFTQRHHICERQARGC